MSGAPLKLPRDMPEDIAAIASEATSEAAERLVAIAEDPDRKRAKAARRALFILRQHGVEPPAPRQSPASPEGASADVSSSRPSVQCYLAHEGPGRRHLLLLAPEVQPQRCSIVVLSADGRVLECMPHATTLATVDREFRREGKEGLAGMIRLTADQARYLLEEGVRAVREAGELVPLGFQLVYAELPPPERAPLRAPIYDFIPEEELGSDPLGQYPATSLVKVYEALAAQLPAEAIDACADRVLEAMSSPLVLADHQRASYILGFLRETTDAVLSPPRAAAIVRQLELDALRAWQMGFRDVARLIAFHALAGRRAATPSEWPLAISLVEQRVHVRVQHMLAEDGSLPADEEDEDEPEPRIIVPGR